MAYVPCAGCGVPTDERFCAICGPGMPTAYEDELEVALSAAPAILALIRRALLSNYPVLVLVPRPSEAPGLLPPYLLSRRLSMLPLRVTPYDADAARGFPSTLSAILDVSFAGLGSRGRLPKGDGMPVFAGDIVFTSSPRWKVEVANPWILVTVLPRGEALRVVMTTAGGWGGGGTRCQLTTSLRPPPPAARRPPHSCRGPRCERLRPRDRAPL